MKSVREVRKEWGALTQIATGSDMLSDGLAAANLVSRVPPLLKHISAERAQHSSYAGQRSTVSQNLPPLDTSSVLLFRPDEGRVPIDWSLQPLRRFFCENFGGLPRSNWRHASFVI